MTGTDLSRVEVAGRLLADSIRDIPAPALDFQPAPFEWSLRQVVAHVASANNFYLMIVEAARSALYEHVHLSRALPQYRAMLQTNRRVLEATTTADLVDISVQELRNLLDALGGVSDEELDRPYRLSYGWQPNQPPVTTTHRKRVVDMAITHMEEHRLQISKACADWKPQQPETVGRSETRRYQAVLFDADQTLWRGTATMGDVWYRLFADAGASLERSLVESAVRTVYGEFWAAFRSFENRGSPVPEQELTHFWERLNESILDDLGLDHLAGRVLPRVPDAFRDAVNLFPDVTPVLESLRRRGHGMAVVSNGMYQAVIAERLGIAHYFKSIIGSVHVGFAKPDPEIFRMALKELGFEAADALMVGDTWSADVEGALSAGITPVLIDRASTNAAPNNADVAVIADLSGLLPLLDQQA